MYTFLCVGADVAYSNSTNSTEYLELYAVYYLISFGCLSATSTPYKAIARRRIIPWSSYY